MSLNGGKMSTILNEIENYDACAASVLKKADFQTDSELQTLTPEDMRELFPGLEKLALRKTIFEIIKKQKGTHQCQEKLEGLIPQDTLKNVVIAECFERIKNTKNQLDERKTVLEARHNKLKDVNKTTVKYKMVLCGETFGAHDQLLEQINTSELKLIKGTDEERCITIVFCPVSEAAMKTIPGDDPVILVLMHHSQQPQTMSPTGISTHFPNVVLEVNIFYHDGLLMCEQNEKAVNELKEELVKHRSYQKSGSKDENQSGGCRFI
ncbi:hypothetical protein OJAV_G00233000 [Oryzias javanicus]|uniref:Uncharacterized protein n=1 Tax=Oryzias javanicus TaxID=123683 RepID=A0A437C072_ORYJA|nr:hypothetical protein OJAV_G00233000 [Oryzias javanicus]